MTPYQIALSEYGIKEDLSVNSNPEVLKYYAKIGQGWVKDDSTAWCAAFMGYCLETAGITSTKALNARSYLNWGTSTKTPKVGDIVVFWRISPTSVYGHVGYFISHRNGVIYTLGGNEGDMVQIQGYPESQVLDYRTDPRL